LDEIRKYLKCKGLWIYKRGLASWSLLIDIASNWQVIILCPWWGYGEYTEWWQMEQYYGRLF
jgi:hypothetical protein